MSWSTTPPAPINKPGWTTDPTIHIPSGTQQWAVYITPRIRAALRSVQAGLVGEVRQQGTVAAQLRHALFSGTGAQSQSGDIAALLQAASFTGTNITLGQLQPHLTPATAALVGGQQMAGTMGATLRPATATAAGQHIITASIAAQLPAALATLAGTQGIPGTLAAQLKTLAAAAAGSQTISGAIAAALRRLVLAASGQQVQSGTLAAELKTALATITGTVQSLVVFDNSTDGGSGGTTTRSWSHTNTGNCITVGFSNSTSSASTCTYGGVTIPRVYGPVNSGTVFPANGYYSVFALISNSLPQGANTVSCTQAGTASSAGAVTWKNAGSFATIITNSSNGAINISTVAGNGRAAFAGFGGGGISFGAITPNEAMRYGFSAFVTWPHVIGYGLDTGSGITFNATQSSSKAGAVVTILPA